MPSKTIWIQSLPLASGLVTWVVFLYNTCSLWCGVSPQAQNDGINQSKTGTSKIMNQNKCFLSPSYYLRYFIIVTESRLISSYWMLNYSRTHFLDLNFGIYILTNLMTINNFKYNSKICDCSPNSIIILEALSWLSNKQHKQIFWDHSYHYFQIYQSQFLVSFLF